MPKLIGYFLSWTGGIMQKLYSGSINSQSTTQGKISNISTSANNNQSNPLDKATEQTAEAIRDVIGLSSRHFTNEDLESRKLNAFPETLQMLLFAWHGEFMGDISMDLMHFMTCMSTEKENYAGQHVGNNSPESIEFTNRVKDLVVGSFPQASARSYKELLAELTGSESHITLPANSKISYFRLQATMRDYLARELEKSLEKKSALESQPYSKQAEQAMRHSVHQQFCQSKKDNDNAEENLNEIDSEDCPANLNLINQQIYFVKGEKARNHHTNKFDEPSTNAHTNSMSSLIGDKALLTEIEAKINRLESLGKKDMPRGQEQRALGQWTSYLQKIAMHVRKGENGHIFSENFLEDFNKNFCHDYVNLGMDQKFCLSGNLKLDLRDTVAFSSPKDIHSHFFSKEIINRLPVKFRLAATELKSNFAAYMGLQ